MSGFMNRGEVREPLRRSPGHPARSRRGLVCRFVPRHRLTPRCLFGKLGLQRGERACAPVMRRGLLDELCGQAAVEMALLIPVIVATALIAFNVMRFAELCARFDRVAPDAVLAHGVSPAGGSNVLAGVDAVKEAIEKGVGGMDCEVEVSAEDLGGADSGTTFALAAGTCRFTCKLSYTPWPSSVSIAGVGFSLPAMATHERSVVVDRWKAAIVT